MRVNIPSRETVGEVLSAEAQHQLHVPDFQRSYTWTTKELDQFWADVSAFVDRNGEDHDQYFLGAVVAVESAGRLVLIDGQQRFATLTMLLAALRDAAEAEGSDVLADRIQRGYILTRRRGENRYSLTLNRYDRDFFRNRIQAYPPSDPEIPPSYPSHHAMLKARDLLAREVREILEPIEPARRVDYIESFYEVVAHQLVVVLVTTETEDDGNQVFEVLNDRGVSLSTLDLLRNYILSSAEPDSRESIVEMWSDVFGLSESAAQIQTFLRHYWISRHGDVKSRGLYKEMKAVLRDEFEEGRWTPLRFSIDISTSAGTYKDLIDASTGELDLDRALLDVAQLGSSSLLPVLLAALERSDPDSTRRIAESAVNLYVRWSVIGGLESTKLEEHIFNVAEAIYNERLDIAAALRSLADFAPTDEEFKEGFKRASLSRPGYRRHVVERIEQHRRAAEERDELQIGGGHTVHVEHIFPQKPSEELKFEGWKDLIQRIGNLTLLHGRKNQRLQNRPFHEKKATYAESELLVTQNLADSPHELWQETQIDERQEQLADMAPEIWPIG